MSCEHLLELPDVAWIDPLSRVVREGSLQFKNGRVDPTCAAVASGWVILLPSGTVDKQRSMAVIRGELVFLDQTRAIRQYRIHTA